MPNLYMRTVVVGVMALAGASTAVLAQGRSVPSGTYGVKFDQVANSCSGDEKGLAVDTGTLAVSAQGATVTLKVPPLPVMTGEARTGGKVRATSAKSALSIRGVDGRFTAAGKVERARVQLVVIAEYFRGDRAVCTQSWNVVGPRK